MYKLNKKVILISLVVLVVAALGIFWYWREAMFSKDILKLEILAADSVKAGDEIEYTVKYKNNGNFALENPKFSFELPENSLTEDGKNRFTKDLKDTYPGDEEFLKFTARIIGKEGDTKSARATLSYTPHNLTVRYESTTTFTTKIESVPITLTYDLPSKMEKGKEMSYAINYFSNIDYPLEDLSIKIDPTEGFQLTSAEPMSLDNTEWKLATLTKGKGGRVKIKGLISSDALNNLHFSAKLGVWQAGSFVVLKEVNQEVEIIKSLLYISQEINGSANYTASPGETLNYRIFLRNIGSSAFDNLFVISRLDGQALDLSTLKSSEGKVQQNDNLIVFDSREMASLQHLAPQQEVHVGFSVKLKEALQLSGNNSGMVIKNKVNALDVSVEFETKVGSKVEISQKAYHSTFDGIENSGPVPPEVGKTTMYVVNWKIKNSFNNVKNVKVKASLSDKVSLSDALFPEDQFSRFSFDSASKEIVWLAGDLASGSEASLSFQIGLTPSPSERGSLARLINQATVFAEDQFTGSESQNVTGPVNTSLPDDEANSGGGIVQ